MKIATKLIEYKQAVYNTMTRAQAQSVTFDHPPHEYEMVSPSSSAVTNDIDDTNTTNNTTTTTTTNTIVDEAQECLAQALLMFLYADLRLLSATGRINTRFETLR